MTAPQARKPVLTINGIPHAIKEGFQAKCKQSSFTYGAGIEAAITRLPDGDVPIPFETPPPPPKNWNVRVGRDLMDEIRKRCGGHNVSNFIISAIKLWISTDKRENDLSASKTASQDIRDSQ